jgi:hypothetical protein
MSFIQDFLAPLGTDAFLKAFQDNRPFLIPGNAAKIETLFGGPMGKTELLEILERAHGLADFDRNISLFPSDYQVEGFEAEPPPQIAISPRSAMDIVTSGSNHALNFFHLHLIDERLLQFHTRLKQGLEIVGKTGTAFFYHPPGGRGIHLHYDHNGGFQVLLSGTKHWRISPRPVDVWPRSSAYTRRDGKVEVSLDGWDRKLVTEQEMDLMDIEMNAGDILYVPPGCWHATRSQPGGSIGMTFAFYPATFRELVDHALLDRFEPQTGWRSPMPLKIAGAGKDAESDTEMTTFFSERLEELKQFVNGLKPDGPELRRARQKLLAQTPKYLAPHIKRKMAHEKKTVDEGDRLSMPIDAPVTSANDHDENGNPVLFVYYGKEEVCFDDPRFLPFAHELLRQTSFTARDSLSWAPPDGQPYSWDEMVPMLDGLLSVGILTRR